MLMSRPYINITTTSYCADPKKVVPVFGLDAKFGNNSFPGYQISPITSYSYRRCFYFCGKKRETDTAFRRITQK